MSRKFVIIGGDAAGMSAASKIRRLNKDATLIVFERGPHISFAACGMPYWISGVIEDGSKLQVLTPEIARTKRNIDVRTGHEVLNINTESKRVLVKELATDKTFEEPYDSLLIATGASSVIPTWPGVDSPGVFTLRSLADGERIKDYLEGQHVTHATIIGGGHIGLEMAEAFRQLGIQATMLVRGDQIASSYDQRMLEAVNMNLLDHGVDLRYNTQVTAIKQHTGHRLEVMTTQGSVRTDMILVSTGVKPNTKLAESAGILLGQGGGIKVDKFMKTNMDSIYAAGDCISSYHLVLEEEIWISRAPAANKGGKIAGENMAGGNRQFPGVLGTSVAKVFDFTLGETGITEQVATSSEKFGEIAVTQVTSGNRAHYYPGSTPITIKLITEKVSGRLLGAQMVGQADVAKRLDVLATAITAKMTVADIGFLDLAYAPPFAPVYDPIHIAANVANK